MTFKLEGMDHTMTEETAAILQELRTIRAEQAEQFRLLKNKLSSLRWVVNRMRDEQEHIAGVLDDGGANPNEHDLHPDRCRGGEL